MSLNSKVVRFSESSMCLSSAPTWFTSLQVYYYSQHILQCDIRNIINVTQFDQAGRIVLCIQ